jgi:chromosome segregation ATPase
MSTHARLGNYRRAYSSDDLSDIDSASTIERRLQEHAERHYPAHDEEQSRLEIKIDMMNERIEKLEREIDELDPSIVTSYIVCGSLIVMMLMAVGVAILNIVHLCN